MTAEQARKPRAFASEQLRQTCGTGTPLAPVPSLAIPGWNARIRRWAEAA